MLFYMSRLATRAAQCFCRALRAKAIRASQTLARFMAKRRKLRKFKATMRKLEAKKHRLMARRDQLRMLCATQELEFAVRVEERRFQTLRLRTLA